MASCSIMNSLRRFNTTVTVEPMFFLFFCSVAVLNRTIQQTVYMKYCVREGYNVSECANDTWAQQHQELQKKTSYWNIYSNLVLLLPMVLSLTMLSGYSNRHSLFLSLALPFIGGIIATLWIILQVLKLEWDPNLLLITFVFWGLTGFFPLITMAGTTYVIRDPDVNNLVLRLAILESMHSLGTATGVSVVGPILDISPTYGLVYASILYGSLQLLGLADILFRLKSIPAPNQNETDDSSCAHFKHFFNMESFTVYFTTISKKRENSKRLHLNIVALCSFIAFMSAVGVADITFLYLTKEYSKSNTEYSIYSGLNSIVTLIGSTVGVYLFTKYHRLSDIGFFVLGAISGTISYTLLGYANNLVCYWLAVVFRLFVSYSQLGGRLYVSHLLDRTEQATGMGYLAIMECKTVLFSGIIFNSIYPLTLDSWSGSCFALAAFLLVLTVPALTFVEWNDNRHDCVVETVEEL